MSGGWLDRVELSRTFDESAADYQFARPDYPSELFDDLVRTVGLESTARLLEIGCGPGKASGGSWSGVCCSCSGRGGRRYRSPPGTRPLLRASASNHDTPEHIKIPANPETTGSNTDGVVRFVGRVKAIGPVDDLVDPVGRDATSAGVVDFLL